MWLARPWLMAQTRRVALAPSAARVGGPLRLCSTASTTTLTTAAASSSGPVGLVYTCRLLNAICRDTQANTVKRKRVRGAVRKMEADVLDSFTAATAPLSTGQKRGLMREWLRRLAAAAEYLPRRETVASTSASPMDVEADRFSPRTPRHARHDRDDGETWSGASPYFTLPTSDLLCLCLRECAMAAPDTPPTVLRELLECAVRLELGEVEVLQHIVHVLTGADACRRQGPEELVALLHTVSLAVKRCKLPTPPLDRVLCVLPAAKLTAHENLLLLSSLHRLQETRAMEVVAAVSRKAAAQVPEYNTRNVIYALEVAALLPGCNDAFAAATLQRAGTLAPTMAPKELGAVCKYVALLNPSRRHNTLAYSCGAELRNLVPLLVERAEQLLGRFRLHEARYVQRCLREHKVRHSLIFSRLTPVVEDR